MIKKQTLASENAASALQLWGSLSTPALHALREITKQFTLSVAAGDITLLNGKWYVTHSGLLRLAVRRRCLGIKTSLQQRQSDASAGRWVFRAVVYRGAKSKGFVGYGDADPSNVSSQVRGAEMRVAETRAVNRALRKAYGIGLCSVEELGAFSSSSPGRAEAAPPNGACSPNGHGRTQPRLRDQLCLTIRRFKLDPILVKAYAADFCGTESLSEASRESVEAFITHLNKSAEENRDALICKLNSFAPYVEVPS